jgi:hypothetical protein
VGLPVGKTSKGEQTRIALQENPLEGLGQRKRQVSPAVLMLPSESETQTVAVARLKSQKPGKTHDFCILKFLRVAW